MISKPTKVKNRFPETGTFGGNATKSKGVKELFPVSPRSVGDGTGRKGDKDIDRFDLGFARAGKREWGQRTTKKVW